MLSQPSDSESEHNYLGSIQPTLNDVLLALTLPPSALALSVWMPKRRRERILEVTKTVTVTELAHAHPKLLRNRHHSVSNVEVGDGHPVTLHISQTTDQYEAAPSPKSEAQSEPLDFTYRNPLINCDDDEDVVETVHTVNEKFIQFPESMIVDVQSKVNKSHSGNNADNIVDISFDTSRTELNKTSGHKKAHLSAYFRPSRSLDVLLLSPTDTGFYTSPNRSGLVDGSESDGSMIIHTDDERRLDSGVSSVTGIRIRGNKAFGGRANRLVPVSSDDDDLIYLPSMPTTSSTLPRSSRKKARGGRKYIVTSLTKSQSNPSIYQNISNNSSTAQKVKNSVSQGEIDKIADHGQDESTNRSHLYIKNSCKPSHSYTVTAVTETTHQDVPTDSERDLSIHKITVDLELDRLQKSGTHLNEIIRIENVYQNELTSLPPRMSSTPLSTLEKTQKRSHEINHGVKVYTSFDGVEIHVSNTEESHPMPKVRQAVSPIIVVNQNRSRKGSTDNLLNSARDNRRKSTVTDIDWFAAFNMKEPITPRSPRSPLPIDALRECERYVLEHGNFSKKIPLAHIEVDDIFKCVNDGSLNVNVCACSACTLSKIPDEELRRMLKSKIEATRRNTYIYPEDREPTQRFLKSSIPLSSISVDDVFGHPENSSKNHDLSEITIEREKMGSVTHDPHHSSLICCTATLKNKHESPEKKTSEQFENFIENHLENHQTEIEPKTSRLDISLDDVFASTSTGTSKKDSIDYDKYLQRGRELRETSTGGFNTSVVTSETVTTHRRQSSIPDADVSVDELFDTTKPTPPSRQARPAETVEVDVEVHQPKEEPKSSGLDISLDDVFASTSTEPSKKNSIDYDKYLQRGRELRETSTGGFNTSVVTSETVTTHRRQSSIPDADVSVDELFDSARPTPPVRYARPARVVAVKVDRDASEAPVVDDRSEESLVDSEPYIPTKVPSAPKDIDAPAVGLKRKMGRMTLEKSIGGVCSQRRGSLPTPPNSLCDSSEELFLDSTVSRNRRKSYDSDDNGEVSDNRTRSKSVTSMNGKKVFTVTFPEQSELMEETEKTEEPERPAATRKIRKPTPHMQRTSVFDIFNINSGEDSEDGRDEEDYNDSVSSGSGVLRRDRCLDETPSVSSSLKQFSGKLPIITRIHSTSLAVSLDDLGKTESEDTHIIPSEPYEVLEGFPTVVPSRRASRFSIRTDELDENHLLQDYSRAKTRALTSTFSEYYDDLKSPPHTPIKLRRRSISFYYEEPVEMPVEEEVDVQDFVDEILNQSLDEAAFLATSKHMSFKKEVPRSTDTSIDRKQSETDSSILSDMTTSSIIQTSEQMADKVFVSSTNRNSLYEAILTCPGTDTGPMSPTLLPKKEEKTDNINVNINLDKKTFISEATVVMKENQSEDYLVRLIFPEKPVETIIVQENYEESDNQSRNTTNVTSKIKHIVEKMPPQQKDDEYLEVEVNSEYFIIHGKYSMIIHKTEPLGEMLSKIQTSSLDFTVTPKIRKILRQCLHNKISGNNGTDISSRAFHMMNRADPAYDNLNQMSLNRFAHNNRNGNINFCTAENMVCRPLIQNRIRENLNIVEDHLFHYGPGGGYEDVKETILGYLKKFMKGTHVQKKDLVLVGSGNTCYDLICHCLFESEDVILTNTPSYARLFLDCSERAGCRVEAVPIDLDNLQIDLQSFERVLKEQREQGNSVKGIVLINPNNPLGITFPKSQVLALGDWAANNDLNLIVDESFSNSNYGTENCESFLSYQHELKNPSKAVWFWSLSKDFGLPGVKIATLHTPNPSLKEGIAALELIYPVSALAQDFASNLLSDYQWAEQFHETKNHRISKHYEFVSANLKALNLNYITATSGFYVLVDFGQKMNCRTFEEEDRVWHLLIANGIFMTRGRDMRCAQAGWMRLVFGCDKDQVEEGIRRLHKMFGSTANVIGSINY